MNEQVMIDEANVERRYPTIPHGAFDREYATQWKKEVLFLKDKGIRYVFKKRIGEYQIITYKYRKSPELFMALAEFYNQADYRRNMDNIDRLTKQMEQGYIEVQPDEAEKKLMEDDTV